MYVCALWVVSLTLTCVALRVCSRGPGREPEWVNKRLQESILA